MSLRRRQADQVLPMTPWEAAQLSVVSDPVVSDPAAVVSASWYHPQEAPLAVHASSSDDDAELPLAVAAPPQAVAFAAIPIRTLENEPEPPLAVAAPPLAVLAPNPVFEVHALLSACRTAAQAPGARQNRSFAPAVLVLNQAFFVCTDAVLLYCMLFCRNRSVPSAVLMSTQYIFVHCIVLYCTLACAYSSGCAQFHMAVVLLVCAYGVGWQYITTVHNVLYCTVPCCTVHLSTVTVSTARQMSILHTAALYCTGLYCTPLYCTVTFFFSSGEACCRQWVAPANGPGEAHHVLGRRWSNGSPLVLQGAAERLCHALGQNPAPHRANGGALQDPLRGKVVEQAGPGRGRSRLVGQLTSIQFCRALDIVLFHIVLDFPGPVLI